MTIDRYVFYLLATSAQEISYMERSMLLHGGVAFLANASALSLSMQANQFKELRRIQNKPEESMRLSKESELMDLRHQLQPHFLFNSLNSIIALITTKPEKAREMIFQLSACLRGSIRTDQTTLVSLENEIESINLYLAIEKVRFGHRLQTDLSVDENVQHVQIPPLLLQPLVENAIKFGLYGTIGDVNIEIKAFKDGDYLIIEITNPFDQDAQSQKGTGFGLASVERRLNLIYGRNDLIKKEVNERHFIATIKIPTV